MGDVQPGLQARLMSQAMRKLTASISKSRTMVIFINQIRMKIGVMYGSPETTTGGNALKFYASVRLDIRRIGAIKDREEVVGNQTRVKVVKNKVAPPFKQVEFDIMYGEGVSKVGELIDLGVKAGVVEKSGAWFSFDSQRLGQGRENAKSFLEGQSGNRRPDRADHPRERRPDRGAHSRQYRTRRGRLRRLRPGPQFPHGADLRCDFDESNARRAAKSVWRHTVEPPDAAGGRRIATRRANSTGRPQGRPSQATGVETPTVCVERLGRFGASACAILLPYRRLEVAQDGPLRELRAKRAQDKLARALDRPLACL